MDDVRAAYSKRSEEYATLLDSMEPVHPSDRQLVTKWADSIDGIVIDAGCGPGQWTNYLGEIGSTVRGVDMTPAFIEHARSRYPDSHFEIGRVEDLDARNGAVAGVLAWYSLIHHDPGAIHLPLNEFARVLSPGGGLLIGFFEGPTLEPFDHAVATAFRWPVPELSERVRVAGFEVVETHTRTGPEHRPHGALVAARR